MNINNRVENYGQCNFYVYMSTDATTDADSYLKFAAFILTAYDTVSKTHVNFLNLVYSCRGRFSQFEDEFQIWGPCATFRDNYGQIWVISYIFVHFAYK